MIIIVNGNSGAGKTYLLQQLRKEKNSDFVPLKKYTTRCVRSFEQNEDSVDLIYGCKKDDILNFEYNYPYKGEHYAIDKDKLTEVLKKGKVPVLIVRSFDIIKKIKNDFKDVLVLFMLGETGENLNNILENQGRNQNEIGDTDEGLKNILNEFVLSIDLVDHTLINNLYDRDLLMKQFFHYVFFRRKDD